MGTHGADHRRETAGQRTLQSRGAALNASQYVTYGTIHANPGGRHQQNVLPRLINQTGKSSDAQGREVS